MFQGLAASSMHVPPFVLCAQINRVVGLNSVGLRRNANLTDEDRRQIKEAFRITYRSGRTPAEALAEMDACGEWGAAADRFREFIREALAAERPYNRGLCPHARRES
jgi:UDP-N-acetylglucosamine acyltransferase